MTAARLRVVVDDLSGPEVAALLGEHLAAMHEHSPPDSVRALDLSGLRAPGVTFWSAWDDTGPTSQLAGCGALRELDPTHGEVKSMRTAAGHLRRGVAAAVLEQIIGTARARGYARLSLETGSGDAFNAAHALYARYGFVACGPFADHPDNPFSRFFTLPLVAGH